MLDITTDSTINDNDIAPTGELVCEVCGTELVYGGRGRKPRFCADHKPNKTNNNSRPSSSKRTASVDILVSQIEQFYLTLSTALTFNQGTATDGLVIAQNASGLANSWRGLLENDPKIRKFWERMFTASGYGSLLAAHAMVILPILQNHNLLPMKHEK